MGRLPPMLPSELHFGPHKCVFGLGGSKVRSGTELIFIASELLDNVGRAFNATVSTSTVSHMIETRRTNRRGRLDLASLSSSYIRKNLGWPVYFRTVVTFCMFGLTEVIPCELLQRWLAPNTKYTQDH